MSALQMAVSSSARPRVDLELLFGLARDQREAFVEMCHHAEAALGPEFLTLSGYAGTGKSTTLKAFAAAVAVPRVWLCGPTHKSVRVLRRLVGEGDRVRFATVQSALSLRVKKRGGQTVLEPAGRPKVQPGEALVVDECSMLDAALMRHLRDLAQDTGARVVFVGDPAQLPPIGEAASESFSAGPGVTLREVKRQGAGSPVLTLCTEIRDAIEAGSLEAPAFVLSTDADNNGVHVGAGQYDGWMFAAFAADRNFDSDPDRFRVIAWTNAEVRRVNARIQALRYPGLDTPFAIGEPVVIGEPVMAAAVKGLAMVDDKGRVRDDDEVVVSSQTEGRVLAIERTRHPVYDGLATWAVTVAFETAEEHTLLVLDESARGERDQMAEKARQHALDLKRAGTFGSDVGLAWRRMFRLKEAFADLRCAYAMTAHRAQGSTFENVFVNARDILRNPNRPEALRCLYVACSRASLNLVINA